ncbi:bifunctional phosphopantothenoylcysteine decarboxylase/phosphopantothenate--cysteine ligase CoaBC, partial [Ligilactobacillus equi]|uniref:bifunctional phosphopantothenoylcysteine decarboxylase/phosphopantothenate--cysteine ligase CoaBC n=1 Tax=Ligilactobacillus equi TaxID=137357 RepID=UPI000555EDB5
MTAKKIVLYVTGGIAAYKVPLLARDLIKKGYQVQVAMTQEAQKYVTPTTLQVLTKQPVYTDFTPQEAQYVPHIHLAQWADLAVVVPATANMIAKMAQGLADDFVSTTLLATPGPILVVPAMNDHMWENPATQRNIAQLKADGKRVLEPAHGFLAEGYAAKGRMPEPIEISQAIDESFQSQDLQERRIVITAGGTQEDLDPVRYLTNKSSGKMGYALAQIAQARGAHVTLISVPTNLTPPTGVDFQPVRTAQEMQVKVNQVYAQADVVIMAAAVADYLPAQTA